MEKTLKENKIFDGRVLKFYNDEVVCENGAHSTREYVKHPGGACILAVKDGFIYFEKQFRYPYKKDIIELPAGKLEHNEEPVLAARRELKEELGFISKNMEFIDYMYPSVGYTDEIIYLFYSSDNEASTTDFDADEYIEPLKYSIKDAYKMLDENRIHDAKTVYLMMKMRKRLLGD